MRNPVHLSKILLTILCFLMIGYSQENSTRSYDPVIPGAGIEIYKTVGDVKLRLWIFSPEERGEAELLPAIVFFFGGGWRGGNPEQFAKHCEYLAARGMVAITAEYRVRNRHGVKANVCVGDAKSAIRWIRTNASRLGVNPEKIVAAGGSAGGHLAAATAILPEHDDQNDDFSVSPKPNALVLFNPVVILAPVSGLWKMDSPRQANFSDRLGAEPVSMSPWHHLKKGTAPAIIFHGMNDTTVPFQTVKLFTEKMISLGNRCELYGYRGEAHGFFNFGRKRNAPFIDTVKKMDDFLVSLGYLPAPPEAVLTK